MDLSKALKLVKKGLRKQITETAYFRRRVRRREMDVSHVRQVVSHQNIVGIENQSNNRFRVWFKYSETKDLNIALDILPSGRLVFVTLFPSASRRRTYDQARI
ncbi:hypothetical protein CMO91_02845 [Candidatus Woesearchaeota archaeon]|nr:hypothetical protein [Candidatus Woesearchaeota archaeon]